jgi:hypothetical protein
VRRRVPDRELAADHFLTEDMTRLAVVEDARSDSYTSLVRETFEERSRFGPCRTSAWRPRLGQFNQLQPVAVQVGLATLPERDRTQHRDDRP